MKPGLIFAPFNRHIVKNPFVKREQPPLCCPPNAESLDKSLLGIFGAMELPLLKSFVDWSEADGTTYQ